MDNKKLVSTDDIDEMTISAFKMGITTAEFYQLVKDSIGKKDLLNMIITHAKSTDTAESITKELNSNLQ